jgi:hypothetical protein
MALQTAGVRCPIIGAGWSGVRPDRWPVEAVSALHADLAAQNCGHAARPQGQSGVKVFNDLGFGGYLIYAAPQTRVYIDDRCELYGDYGLREYERLAREPALIDALALYDDIPYALTRAHSGFDGHFAASPFWKLLHRDATAALYARTQATASAKSPRPWSGGGRE